MTTTASGGPQLPAPRQTTPDTDLEEATGTQLCTPTPGDLQRKPRRDDDNDPPSPNTSKQFIAT